MTEKHFIIKLNEELIVTGTSGKITRNSNSTQYLDVELEDWKLPEGAVLYIELSNYNDYTELLTNVGPLQLFYNPALGRYVTLAPPEFISVAGEWEYSIELRFNITEIDDKIGYDSLTSAIYHLLVTDTAITNSELNSIVKETELITAARILAEGLEAKDAAEAARAAYVWNATYPYKMGDVTYCPQAGPFGAFVKSVVDDNLNNPPFNEDGQLNTRYWELISNFNTISKAIVTWGFNEAYTISELEWEVV